NGRGRPALPALSTAHLSTTASDGMGKFPRDREMTSLAIPLTTPGRLLWGSARQEVFFLVSCRCATEGARHAPHAATCPERVVVLLHVVCTQRSATDAAGAIGHKHLGTVLTDLTGALCRGRRHAHIRHFAGDTRAYLSHRLSPRT